MEAGFRSLLAFWLGGAGTINLQTHGKGVGGKKQISNVIRMVLQAQMQEYLQEQRRRQYREMLTKMTHVREATYHLQQAHNKQMIDNAVISVFLAEV